MSLSPVTIRRLTTRAEDTAAVQRLLDETPAYSIAISGAPASADAGMSVFTSRPHGCAEDQKWVMGILMADQVVGVVDLIRGFPAEEFAFLGLLLVSERYQRRGIGRLTMLELETLVRGWPAITRIRLGVVATNKVAIPFWTSLGFKPTGEVKSFRNGSVASEVLLYEKALN